MERRKFVKYLGTGAFLGIAGGGTYWLTAPREHAHLSLDLMLDHLDQLAKAPPAKLLGWDAARTFHHLAQSVEFSMAGFPEAKSALFQNTVGRLAFSVFSARGSMSHGLTEVIPGETVVAAGDIQDGIKRLKTSLLVFKSHEQALQPHFAYGTLSKPDYAIAHALHINNHLEEFDLS